MSEDNKIDIETISSRVVYKNRWMRVREDAIRLRDGSEGIYGVVEKADYVVVMPIDEGNHVHLVQQFRYPVKGRYWEFPQGIWGDGSASPVDAARGELHEETGLTAADMVYGGNLFQGYGYSTQAYHIFLARGLQPGQAKLELEEQDLITRSFAMPEFERMLRDGEIKDASTIAAFGLLRLKGLI
jgi:ADP-ribose pyrophosphatase